MKFSLLRGTATVVPRKPDKQEDDEEALVIENEDDNDDDGKDQDQDQEADTDKKGKTNQDDDEEDEEDEEDDDEELQLLEAQEQATTSSGWEITDFQTRQQARELQILMALYESTTRTRGLVTMDNVNGTTITLDASKNTTVNTTSSKYDVVRNGWYNASGWLSDGRIPCQWAGVVCNPDNYVTALQLRNNNLRGTLPISLLWDLSFLQAVDVSQNPHLVVDFQQQVTITTSTATASSTTTTTPTFALNSTLPNDDNSTTMNSNNINFNQQQQQQQQPQDDGDLTLTIVVSKKQGSSSAQVRKNVTAPIQNLNISDTSTRSLEGIADIAATLQTLDISSTRITQLSPTNLGQLTKLTSLSMNHLSLNWSLNWSLNLNQQQGDDANSLLNSNITAFTTSMIPLANLQYWHASNATLAGTIPSFLQQRGVIPYLKHLDWSYNALTGSLPENFLAGIDNPYVPLHVTLHANQLTGRFPSSLERFLQLSLEVTQNQMTGEIPPALCLQQDWMNGAVRDFGCAAIVCPVGTFSPSEGRQTSLETRCRDCSDQINYLGRTTCDDIDSIVYNDDDNNDNNHDNNGNDDQVDIAGFNSPLMAAEREDNSELDAQLEGLADFFAATGGGNWTENGGWMEPGDLPPANDESNNNNNNNNTDDDDAVVTDVCQWFGVSCTRGVVRELYLPKNNLQGTTPALLFQNLPSLRRIFLQDNPSLVVDFSGLVNTSEPALLDLEDLIISRTATQTLEGISNAPNLEHLDVSATKLSGSTSISEIFSLKKLRTLNMGNNRLGVSIPESIGNLDNLVSLRAPNAALSGTLPTTLSDLRNLVVLDLSLNNLGGPLPAESINALRELRILDLHAQKTSFGGRVLAFDGLPFLLQVDLSSMFLTGTIPANFLNGIRDKFRSIDINLKDNRLGGNLPLELALFQSLNLDVTENQIEAIPEILCIKDDWMDGLVSQFGCDAIMCPPGTSNDYGRMVSAETPCKVCSSEALLYYGSAGCLGDAPTSASTFEPTAAPSTMPGDSLLSQREVLAILYNQTDGAASWLRKDNWLDDDLDICEWYGVGCGDDAQIRSLLLSENGLKGTTPSQLFQLARLERLFLDGNTDLQVDLSSIGSRASSMLRAVVIANTATVSARGLSKASSLQVLDLNNTRVGPEIFDEIASLVNLQSLNVGNTRLDRALPNELGVFVEMRELVAPNAGIQGTIPTSMGSLKGLAVLELSSNKLSGTLPGTFKDLENLRIVDLHDQDISKGGGIRGQLPSFENFLYLNKLDLSSNRLSGSLPDLLFSGIRDKEAALDVNLSNNLLYGSLPQSLESFSELNIDVTANLISHLPSSLCSKDMWINGNVGKFGCDAILCPPGTFNSRGRQVNDSEPCEPCLGNPVPFFGSVSCSQTPEQIQSDTSICLDGRVCYNGGVCANNTEFDPALYLCDCTGTTEAGIPFAGVACEYKATDICHTSGFDIDDITSFCTNNGVCLERVEPNAPHKGCECNSDLWEGQYCELRRGFLEPTPTPAAPVPVIVTITTQPPAQMQPQVCSDGRVCQNGGKCMETGAEGSYACDCTHLGVEQLPYAGDRCQFPATSLCSLSPPYTSFCVNGGACIALVDAGSEHANCTCPEDFTGEHCQVPMLMGPEISAEDQYVAPPTSSDEGMQPWQMALVFVLPALAILIIVAMIFAAYSMKKKKELKYVNVENLRDSEYDRYIDRNEDPETPRNFGKDDDLSELETPPSIIDRALATHFSATTNGTAFFSLPDSSRDYHLSDEEEDSVVASSSPPASQVGQRKETESPDTPTTLVSKSTEIDDSPTGVAGVAQNLSAKLDESNYTRTQAETNHRPEITHNAEPADNVLEGPTTDCPPLEDPKIPDTSHSTPRNPVKCVRINDNPQIVTLESDDSASEEEEEEDKVEIDERQGTAAMDSDEEEHEEEENHLMTVQEEEPEMEEEEEMDGTNPSTPMESIMAADDSSSDEEMTSGFIGDIVDSNGDSTNDGSSGAIGRSLFSGVHTDDSVSFLEHSVAMSDDSERSYASESQIPRVEVSVAPSLAQSMFGGREASETSSGELSLNF